MIDGRPCAEAVVDKVMALAHFPPDAYRPHQTSDGTAPSKATWDFVQRRHSFLRICARSWAFLSILAVSVTNHRRVYDARQNGVLNAFSRFRNVAEKPKTPKRVTLGIRTWCSAAIEADTSLFQDGKDFRHVNSLPTLIVLVDPIAPQPAEPEVMTALAHNSRVHWPESGPMVLPHRPQPLSLLAPLLPGNDVVELTDTNGHQPATT